MLSYGGCVCVCVRAWVCVCVRVCVCACECVRDTAQIWRADFLGFMNSIKRACHSAKRALYVDVKPTEVPYIQPKELYI